MGQPVIVAREGHTISRKQIDPDALKVLYRLHQYNYTAYLVGGSVRDLLLGRRPKDFDIGTSAHPYQVKKLFRNCWIVGRRFRLAHVRFGQKTVEVATFRRLVTAEEQETGAGNAMEAFGPPGARGTARAPGVGDQATLTDEERDRLIHRDNTFGTPEEDAFRRDFTVNALFYNIADFSIIDYTRGLEDLEARLVRCIGDPNDRFREDPVRMMRAVALAARLDFTIDPPVDAAIVIHRGEIARAAPARLVEEFYKILRAGHSAHALRMMADRGLLQPIAPPLHEAAGPALWRSLAALDEFRNRFEEAPDSLTNAILLGSLLVPLGYTARTLVGPPEPDGEFRREPRLSLGMLPLARRDVERLRQILTLQRRLTDLNLSPRARRGLMHRGPFREALAWLEIHGNAPEVLEHWRGFIEAAASFDAQAEAADAPPLRRRRRRRRRRFPRPNPAG
jgi:poly(A) polymerase